jgi:hypothetical protein
MCALLRFSVASLAVVLAAAYAAASTETGMSAFQPTVIGPAPISKTFVNRTNKGDREITIRNAQGPAEQKRPVTARERKIMDGCDPAFSPLTDSARNNFAGRCVT